MIKKFLSSPTPPALIKGVDRWYIKFYHLDPTTEQRIRARMTCDLNRISDTSQREKEAKRQILRISKELSKNPYFPYVIEESTDSLANELALPCIKYAVDLKCRTDRENTRKGYRSIYNMFSKYFNSKKLQSLTIGNFTIRRAQEFMDWLELKGNINNNTFNNYLRTCKSVFNLLVDREYIDKSPFDKLKRKPKQTKKRRMFTAEEAQIVAAYIKEHHYWLFISIMLEYYLMVRISEQRRLRFSDFILKDNMLIISKENSKSRKERRLTIPQDLIKYFLDARFSTAPRNYVIFGKGLRPHPTTGCGSNALGVLHREVLVKLKNEKQLTDITGLSLYSWKDTGITVMLKKLPAIDVKDQAGHSSIDQTLEYYHSAQVNQKIVDMKVDF